MYCDRNPGAGLANFDRLAFHTPFAGMVVGAHRTLLRKHGRFTRDQVAAHFRDTLEASLVLGQEVGNTYSASLYVALCSLLAHGAVADGQRVGLFSYGSGCCSEFYSGTLGREAAHAAGPAAMTSQVATRRKLDMATYELVSKLSEDRFSGVKDAEFSTGPYQELYDDCLAGTGLAVLDSIKNYERAYRFA